MRPYICQHSRSLKQLHCLFTFLWFWILQVSLTTQLLQYILLRLLQHGQVWYWSSSLRKVCFVPSSFPGCFWWGILLYICFHHYHWSFHCGICSISVHNRKRFRAPGLRNLSLLKASIRINTLHWKILVTCEIFLFFTEMVFSLRSSQFGELKQLISYKQKCIVLKVIFIDQYGLKGRIFKIYP